jgi:hypothetical protein
MRATEGGHVGGVINIVVLPKLPPRVGVQREYRVPPLPLHARLRGEGELEPPKSEAVAPSFAKATNAPGFAASAAAASSSSSVGGANAGPTSADANAATEKTSAGTPIIGLGSALSSISVRGPFSMKDAHGWIMQSLFDVPEKIVQPGEGVEPEMRLAYRNTFVRSRLYLRYRKGEIDARSENPSTLAALRDFVTHAATQRKLALQMTSAPRPEGLVRTLQLLDAHVAKLNRTHAQSLLLEGLREIEAQECDLSFLAPDLREILTKAAEIAADELQREDRLKYLGVVMRRLLKDACEFYAGAPPTPKQQQALDALLADHAHCTTAALVDLFTRAACPSYRLSE